MICYVRFTNVDGMIQNLLFCKNITASAKAQDLFVILNNFMSENNLDCTKCVDVCTDGALSMFDCYVRLTYNRYSTPNYLFYCFIFLVLSSETIVIIFLYNNVLFYCKLPEYKQIILFVICTSIKYFIIYGRTSKTNYMQSIYFWRNIHSSIQIIYKMYISLHLIIYHMKNQT